MAEDLRAKLKEEIETRKAIEGHSREVMSERNAARSEVLYLRSEVAQLQSRMGARVHDLPVLHVAEKQSSFDYSVLTPDVADAAQIAAKRIRARLRKAIVDTGRDLLDMKERLGHGHFLPWIAAEFGGMSERTAQGYMSVAREFGETPATVADLSVRTALKLAAKSTPQGARDGYPAVGRRRGDHRLDRC